MGQCVIAPPPPHPGSFDALHSRGPVCKQRRTAQEQHAIAGAGQHMAHAEHQINNGYANTECNKYDMTHEMERCDAQIDTQHTHTSGTGVHLLKGRDGLRAVLSFRHIQRSLRMGGQQSINRSISTTWSLTSLAFCTTGPQIEGQYSGAQVKPYKKT